MPEQQRVESEYSRDEILHIRHPSLFAPRDFDLSPYFQVVKPTICVSEHPTPKKGPYDELNSHQLRG